MARRSARFAEKLLVKSPQPNCVDSSKKKPTTIKQYFTALDPYVSIEKLNLETPKKILPVKPEEKVESESKKKPSKENGKPVKSNEKKKEIVNTKSTYEMSEYEKMIQENIEARRKMFQELVGEAKNDFEIEVNREKATNKATQRGLKRKVDER